MSGHIEGPLTVAESYDNDGCTETVLRGLDGRAAVAVVLDFGPNNPGMREANARRLVACWKAMIGVPTEWLESFAISNAENEAQENARLVVQNATLIRALKDISEKTFDAGFHVGGPAEYCNLNKDAEGMKALLTRACCYLQDISGIAGKAIVINARKQTNDVQAVIQQRDDLLAAMEDIASQMRKAGASVPAPENKGTIESAMATGLSLGLLLVQDAIASARKAYGMCYYAPDGTLMNPDGTRSIFDDVDQ
jgi:hypothetical protein